MVSGTEVKMKVLFVMHDDDKFGAPQSMLKMIELLKKNDHIYPIVLTPKKNRVNEKCSIMGIENYSLCYRTDHYNQKNVSINFYINVIINFVINIYFFHRIKKIVNIEEINIIHSAVSTESQGLRMSKKFNIPLVVHLREMGVDNRFSHQQIVELSSGTQKFIAISRIVSDYWILMGIDENKIEIIYNGIDNNDIKTKENYFLKQNLSVILVSNISPEKGIHIAIDAMKMAKNFFPDLSKVLKMDIVGSYQKKNQKYFKKLKNEIVENELLDTVHFLGYLTNVSKMLYKYDVGIMSSKAEAFGRTTVEYMMAGLPVVASNSGANPELIKDNKDGFLYNPGSAEDLIDKLIYIYRNKADAKKIGQNARKTALNKYTAEHNAHQVFRVYEETILEQS